MLFLSTPSARRATPKHHDESGADLDFYPRPPRGGRPGLCKPGRAGYPISIHALREEGDFPFCDFIILYFQFLSTPSARRATYRILVLCVALKISIHALREEGDTAKILFFFRDSVISIHALREEGDDQYNAACEQYGEFLSTPSARRATEHADHRELHGDISIHALREEGDSKNRDKISIFKQIIQHSARI